MSLTAAKRTLHRARRELHHAHDSEDVRQAAEKAWRAAREAVYTAIASVEDKPKGTWSPSKVADFEARKLDQEYLTDRYSRAMQVLHGECFYDGDVLTEEMMEREMDSVARLISDAEHVLVLLRQHRRK
jgi:hypothetical protein